MLKNKNLKRLRVHLSQSDTNLEYSLLVQMVAHVNWRGSMMIPEEKKPLKASNIRKSYWHLYSLQTLESEKLAKIINKVLRRECVLIK